MGFLNFIFRGKKPLALENEPEFPPELLRQRLPLGPNCERLACWYLESKGMKCLGKNVRSRVKKMWGPVSGELDLVMEIPDPSRTLVFVEVRSRARNWDEFGLPSQSIGYRKQQRVCHAARGWLLENQIPVNRPVRFDVVSIIWEENQRPKLWHAPNAFTWS
ncbi:MAG: YraN family protein [Thermoguttaceae bacterium]|nr:YraN family protein [Thermoguttaceae bacterium]MDO4424895.1 YraN family protein [Planctomycetia bacterium]